MPTNDPLRAAGQPAPPPRLPLRDSPAPIPSPRDLQTALATAGFYVRQIDDVWGPYSQGALAGYYESQKRP